MATYSPQLTFPGLQRINCDGKLPVIIFYSDGRMRLPQITILGVGILQITASTANQVLEEALSTGNAHSIAFANANLLNMSARDAVLRQALANTFVLNDGVGINSAARHLYKRRFPDNLNGTDFVPAFLDRIPAGTRIYLLGATPEVNAETVGYVRSRWPGHQVVGSQHGFFAAEQVAGVMATLEGLRPQIVLVAMGNGLQEKVCRHIAARAGGLCFGVGALFDFWTQKQPRAPIAFRRIGAEWIYRLWREPRRMWRRYLIGNPAFLFRVWCQGRSFAHAIVPDEGGIEDPRGSAAG